MDRIEDLLASLHLEQQITLEEIPSVDLYVDQVVQLFENNFSMTTRNDEEKVLTKTMINNYAKGKLFFPIKNKKYSKEHIMLISLIYQLKGALSINDIKSSLHKLNEKVMSEEAFDLAAFYTCYLNIYANDAERFKQEVQERVDTVKEEATSLAEGDLEQTLLLLSLVNMSNLYRRLAEKIVDELNSTAVAMLPHDKKK